MITEEQLEAAHRLKAAALALAAELDNVHDVNRMSAEVSFKNLDEPYQTIHISSGRYTLTSRAFAETRTVTLKEIA